MKDYHINIFQSDEDGGSSSNRVTATVADEAPVPSRVPSPWTSGGKRCPPESPRRGTTATPAPTRTGPLT